MMPTTVRRLDRHRIGTRSLPAMLMRTCLQIVVLAAFALPGHACEPSGEPWFELEVEAAEYAGPDRTLRVALHDDGCAAIRRPAFHRAPGEFRLTVDGPTRQQLALLAGAPELRGFDAAALHADLAQRLATDGRGEVFEVHDAALYRLTLRDAARPLRLESIAVLEYAERFPGVDGLTQFAGVIELAHAIADHPGARPIDAARQP